MLKFISNLFQIDLGLAWVHFAKIINKFDLHDPWLGTCSENHTHASPGGSKGAILFPSLPINTGVPFIVIQKILAESFQINLAALKLELCKVEVGTRRLILRM